MADVTSPSAPDAGMEKKSKPERPDEEIYKADLAKAEKEHAASMERLNKVREKVDLAKPSKGSPKQQRQQELRQELTSIRQQQQGNKSSKGSLQERIKVLDGHLKSRIQEQKNAKGRTPFKSVDEVDREISRLEKQVDSGTMKLVDEKKALADVSSLRKQRKGFAGFDEAQKGIDELKAQLAELRKGLDDPESKALSERYNVITKELDGFKAEQDEAYKSINSLRDERTKLQTEQQQKYQAIHAIKDAYYGQRKAYREYENEAFKARKDRQKAERDAYEKEKRKKTAEKRLEEASEPAYMDEILTAEGLIRYFDPSAAEAEQSNAGPGKFAAQASRTVNDADMKGVRVTKKEDREDDYFAGSSKKGKKGKKQGGAAGAGPAAGGSEGKFNLSIGVIEELSKVNLEPPMNQGDVPAVVEKLQQKLAKWKAEQSTKTQENIAKAKKEIEKFEAESTSTSQPSGSSSSKGQTNGAGQRTTDAARKPGAANEMLNGGAVDVAGTDKATAELTQEKDAAADVANDLKAARIEDAQ